jgi:hypothetical protein
MVWLKANLKYVKKNCLIGFITIPQLGGTIMCFSAFYYLFAIVVDSLLHASRTAHTSWFEFNEF